MHLEDYRPLNKLVVVLCRRPCDWSLPWYPEEARAWSLRLDREMRWCFDLGRTEALL
jgi:hypothetical protein